MYVIYISFQLSTTNNYCIFSQVLVLEPTKVYMPSYLQVNDDDDNKVSTTGHAYGNTLV